MERAMYFRQQAEVLLGISRAPIDLGVARRLRILAAEFKAKADELEDAETDFSDMPVGRRGSLSGETDRHYFRFTSVELIPRPVFVCAGRNTQGCHHVQSGRGL